MSSRFASVTFVSLLVGVAGVGIYLLSTQREPASTERSMPRVEGGPASTPSAPELQSAPAPTRSPERPSAMIRYPDGTFMPALNGVDVVPSLQWPSDLPFSPIVGKRTAAGTEWYVHEDGTQTTTMMTWRSDLGRDDAVCHVARPLPPAPEEVVEDDSKR